MSRKKAGKREAVSSRKQPRQKEDPDQFMDQCPIWKFQFIDMKGKWEWNKVTIDDICKCILPKLIEFEKKKWKEIIREGRRQGSHFMTVSKLSPEAIKRLKELKLDDDRLFSFRFMKRPRMWGIVDQGIYNVLWWDPEHTVFPNN